MNSLPSGVIFEQRKFPNSNFLLIEGDVPTLIDSGFVGCVKATAAMASRHVPTVAQVVNTHWHSDHVGGNAYFQQHGAQILGATAHGEAVNEKDPGCCVAERLDQPVPQYHVDQIVSEGSPVFMGDSEWQVLEVPGHTQEHLAYFEPHHGLLALGDTLSAVDVGWVDVMLYGTPALSQALDSLVRLSHLEPAVILPGHGEPLWDTELALSKAIERMQRQVADPSRAVNYGARRILAFAVMIHNGIAVDVIEEYVAGQQWAKDAAATLGQSVRDFAEEQIAGMVEGGGLVVRHGMVYSAAATEPVDTSVFELPWPKDWA